MLLTGSGTECTFACNAREHMLKQEFLKSARVCAVPPNEEARRAHLHSRKMSQAGCQNQFCFVFSRNPCSVLESHSFFVFSLFKRSQEEGMGIYRFIRAWVLSVNLLKSEAVCLGFSSPPILTPACNYLQLSSYLTLMIMFGDAFFPDYARPCFTSSESLCFFCCGSRHRCNLLFIHLLVGQ